MSTEIKSVGHLGITRFHNGKESALQLTPLTGKDYVQLDQKEIKELISILQDAFNRDIYPSE